MVYYNTGETVVVRIGEVNQVAIVTNIRKKKNQVLGYDVRAEKGSSYILVQVDKPKSIYSIDSTLTKLWNETTDTPTNLHINNSLGHTRANFGPLVDMNEECYEKCADFSFPVVGPRSF